ncbi:MAG: DUF4139 domain-containing protein [Deltaproteobacteria bacterium]|nr:DUF4139 domain-containing protein [Deltaproteobacteria bacterium]
MKIPKRETFLAAAALILLLAGSAHAKVDLVTLPETETVWVTIYNSADLTLVSDIRNLSLKKGENKLQFSWANTLIDPTSLEIFPKQFADQVHVKALSYPPGVTNLGVWDIESGRTGQTPMEISYLTSGLSWRAFYQGVLSADEKTMDLSAYVRVDNASGEDYPNARVRLVVGKVRLLDEIAELARREHPYGRPGVGVYPPTALKEARARTMELKGKMADMIFEAEVRPKEIVKEGVSEYFLYTIEGTETIGDGWSRRLLSFEADKVPVKNFYEYEEDRYGNAVMRFLTFANDKAHNLGDTPIPGGEIQIYKSAGNEGLGYEGESRFDYIPVDEDVKLLLGAVKDVLVSVTPMDVASSNYEFNKEDGDITGWEETTVFTVKAQNTRKTPVSVRITRNVPGNSWEITPGPGSPKVENIDADTFRFSVDLSPGQEKSFDYTLTVRYGTRAD